MDDSGNDGGGQLRARINSLRTQLATLKDNVRSAIQDDDVARLALLQSKVTEISGTLSTLKAEFKATTLSDSLTRELDQLLVFLETGVNSLKNDLRQADRGPIVTTVDVPTVVTREVLQTLDTKKDNEILKLADNVKIIAEVNNRINEKLDEGAEVMEDVDTEIVAAQEKIDQAVGRMKLFKSYMKHTKIPASICIITFIIMIVVWSSKAFCSWGFTWQCP